MDLDLRKLRYFATVAEHRHFGRAAAQLFITQPVLSRQVRALEVELGCALLARTTRSVELTEAGERLHEEARPLLASVDAALRRVHDTEHGVRRLVVAFSPGLPVSKAIRAFAARHPEVETDVLPAHWWEPDRPLRDGRAQVAYLRRPFDDTDLHTVPLGEEPRVACLPARHPLAERTELTSADLDDEPLLDTPRLRTSTLEEKFELIAAGHGIALVPQSLAHSYARPDLAHPLVTDAPTIESCLVVAAGRATKPLHPAKKPLHPAKKPLRPAKKPLRDFLEIATATLRDTRADA